MKIFNIQFLQNNFIKVPKHNNLSPLPYDTVNFSANKAKDIPYSIYQKQREIDILKPVLQEAILNAEVLTPEDISEKTGLDILVVKLRLSTNNEIRQLYAETKAAKSIQYRTNKPVNLQNLKLLLSILASSNQKLTENEIAFYLGIEKDDLQALIKENPDLFAPFNNVLLKLKNIRPLERKKQMSVINAAAYHIGKKCTYELLAKKTELGSETIRARISEDDKFFKRVISEKLYPPDIYSDEEIEKQDDILMNILLGAIKRGNQMNIKQIASSANIFPGTVLIRLKNNDALEEAYNRMMGIDEIEDADEN